MQANNGVEKQIVKQHKQPNKPEKKKQFSILWGLIKFNW